MDGAGLHAAASPRVLQSVPGEGEDRPFEPVAEGLFSVMLLFTFFAFAGFLFCCVAIAGTSDDDSHAMKKNYFYTKIALTLMVLFPLLMSAIKPFTDGPKLYDETHKAACQCKEKK